MTDEAPIKLTPTIGPGRRGYAVLAVVCVVAVVAGLLLACRALDTAADQKRPMFRDALMMAWAQRTHLEEGGTVVTGDLRPGDRMTVGDRTIAVSPGVRLQVTASGAGYCVRGWDQYGDTTPTYCGDATRLPPAMGSLADG